MRDRIPRILAEINMLIMDHEDSRDPVVQNAMDILRRIHDELFDVIVALAKEAAKEENKIQ